MYRVYSKYGFADLEVEFIPVIYIQLATFYVIVF